MLAGNVIEFDTMFRELFEASPEAAIITDEAGSILLCNRQTPLLFGYCSKELEGKNAGMIVPGLLNEEEENAFLSLKKNHQSKSINLDAFKKDGTSFPAEISLSLLVTEKGNFICISFRDITKRKKQSDKLLRAEKNFELLVKSVSDYAIFLIDTEGRVASWNSGAEKIKGYRADEVIGKPIEIFYTEEDINTGVPKNNLSKALQEGHFETEGWRLRKDGTVFFANVVFTALYDEDGIHTGYAKVTKDITEKRKADLRIGYLATIAGNIQDLVIATDNDYRITSWNHAAEKMLGWKPEEVIGKTTAEVLRIIYLDTSREAIVRDFEKEGFWQGEVIYHSKSGTPVNIHATVSYLKDQDGNTRGTLAIARNITKIKEAQNQLSHLANIVEQSSEGIFSRGVDQRFISWNKGAEMLFGYSREEVIGKTPFDLAFLRFTREKIESVQQEIIEKGFWQSEQTFYRKDGSDFYGSVTANLIRNYRGEVNSFYFIVKDISQRKQLEDALKKANEVLEQKVEERTRELASSEKRFRALIENSNDIIILLDGGFNFIYRSPSAYRISGWSNEEVMKGSITNNIHPDDIEYVKRTVEVLMANPGKPISISFRNKHKDGHYLWLEGTATNLLHDREVNAIVLNNRDVTERKEASEKLRASEIRFRSLIENSAEGISLTDEFSNIIYRSPASEKITGIAPMENSVNRTHPDDLEMIKGKLDESKNNPGLPIHFQGRFMHAKGHYYWMEGTLTNLLHVKGVEAIVANYRDITLRKEAEEKIIASEEHYRMLISQLADGLFISSAEGQYTDVNIAGCKMMGYPLEELRGMSIPQLLPEYEIPRLPVEIERLVKEGTTITEWEFRRKDGSTFIGEVITRILPDGRLQAIVRDITDRKEAENKLVLSEKRFRALTENISDAIVMNDAESKIIYQSPSVEKILGYTIEERAGKKVMEYIHPEDRNAFLKLYDNLKDKPNFPLPFEYRFLHKSGSYIWLEGVVTNLLNEPAVNAYVANYRDITERKKAEEALKKSERVYRTIASSIPGSVITLIDPDYRYLLIEGDILEKLGYRKEALLGNLAKDVLDPITYEPLAEEFKRVLQGEMIIRENNRMGYDTISRLIPLKDDNNRVYMIMTVTIDVTEMKKAQREITELNHHLEEKIALRTEQLKKSNEELEAFSYSVSHDLRAPLRGIIGFATILEEDFTDLMNEDAKRITGIIKSNTQKMGALIDDLLTFSRMGRHELQKMTINSNEMVSEIIAANSHRENIEWVVSELPRVEADINTIRQVWINLISNAVKYSSKNEHPRIEIGSQLEGDQIRFYVKDNGVGFDEKYKSKLYGVFQRLHSAADFEGTGIGLAIVEKIVSKHGGTVRAEGKVNEGACFCFSLPATWKNE